jgi:hypothetical protein
MPRVKSPRSPAASLVMDGSNASETRTPSWVIDNCRRRLPLIRTATAFAIAIAGAVADYRGFACSRRKIAGGYHPCDISVCPTYEAHGMHQNSLPGLHRSRNQIARIRAEPRATTIAQLCDDDRRLDCNAGRKLSYAVFFGVSDFLSA